MCSRDWAECSDWSPTVLEATLTLCSSTVPGSWSPSRRSLTLPAPSTTTVYGLSAILKLGELKPTAKYFPLGPDMVILAWLVLVSSSRCRLVRAESTVSWPVKVSPSPPPHSTWDG